MEKFGNELSFVELRCKEVINVIDGKRLGRICDILFSRHCAKVLGFIVPGCIRSGWFKRSEDVFVPFNNICKIGIDVILVELKNCGGVRVMDVERTEELEEVKDCK